MCSWRKVYQIALILRNLPCPETFLSTRLQIMMVFLFLVWHDQYFIIFKDSNVFEFTNFSFKTKYINTAVYSAKSNYLFSRGKQEQKNCWNNYLIKSVYLLIFCQNSMIFKGSPNLLKESYFTGELKLGESYFPIELGLGSLKSMES